MFKLLLGAQRLLWQHYIHSPLKKPVDNNRVLIVDRMWYPKRAEFVIFCQTKLPYSGEVATFFNRTIIFFLHLTYRGIPQTQTF